MKALAILVVVSACASGGDATPPLPTAAVRFRVLTYNMNFGVAGDREGVEAIASARADLVVLQETNEEWERAILAGTKYPHHRFQGPKTAWVAGGMGVLSRWPITTIEELASEAGPFFAWRIVIDAPGGPMQVLNVHLHPPMDKQSGSWVVGYFSTRSIREQEARDHIAKLDPSLPTLVAGDFNEEDEGKAIALFTARGMASALPRFRPDADTWNWTVGATTLRFRLDHILFDRGFLAVGADVMNEGRSDHFPVWADLVRTR